MKLIFRDLTSPLLSFKCGSDPVSATISGMFGAADTAYTNETNRDVAEAQIAAQQRENQLNRDWQTSQAEINRQFQSAEQQKAYAQQTSERLASQEYQAQQWQHQFNEELLHRFDVPSGVNPAVYFSNKGAASGIGGSVSAPSGSAPSAPNGSMPAGVQGLSPVPYQAQRLDIPQMMQGISSIVQAKAAAKKAGAETDLINRSADDVIRKIKAEGDQMETLSSLNKLHVAIQQSKLPYAVKMAEQEYQESLAKIDLMKQEKLTSGEEAALKVATAKLNGALKSLYEKQGHELDVRLQYLPNLLQSQILSNRGSAAAGFASADYNSALAKSENELRGLKKVYQVLINSSKSSENAFGTATFDARAKQEIEKSDLLHNEAVKQAIENKDREAYTSLQRILLGKTQSGDWSKVLRTLSEISISSASEPANW